MLQAIPEHFLTPQRLCSDRENDMKKMILLITLLISAGCQSVTVTDEPVSPKPEPTNVQPPVDNHPATQEPETTPEEIRIAIEDLAARLDLNPDFIIARESRPITWPDASLGCPQEGMMYAQVETEGYIIWLEANVDLYRYHTDTIGNVVLCETPQLPSIPITPGEIDDGQPWMPVD